MGRRSNREMQRRLDQQVERRVIERPDLSMNINPFADHVRLEFNHSVTWLRFTPERARQVAARLMACADEAERRIVQVPKILMP